MKTKSICPRCETVFYSHESESDYCGEFCEILALNGLLYEQKKHIAKLDAQVSELTKANNEWAETYNAAIRRERDASDQVEKLKRTIEVLESEAACLRCLELRAPRNKGGRL